MRCAAASGTVQLAYDVLGAGMPIVMLHDFGESSGFWHEFGFVQACLARGRQVVLVDLRGHGHSSKPADPEGYRPSDYCMDVVAVLDHAGIARAAFLGYGVGGRIALCIATVAPERVHAVAAGSTHPFAERTQLCRDALAKGIEAWVKMMEAGAGGMTAGTRRRLEANDAAALQAAVACDRPDMADAVARSGVPLLLFVGKDDPRYPLALSFAEQSGAKVIGLPGHDHRTAPGAARSEILPRILSFFDEPDRWLSVERPPMPLWSGSWT